MILLNENIKDLSLKPLENELIEWINKEGGKPKEYLLNYSYDDYSINEIYDKLLPPNIGIYSFESVGHLIHLNLKEEQLPYKYIIGQVLLDKNPRMKTVINKIGSINNTFRTFDMELLAGIDDTVVTVNESNAVFTFDYRKVYWNSRLQGEHHKIIDELSLNKNNVVADMFCGVGPFAIPLALNDIQVYANDLNPDSYKYLLINAKKNKVESKIHGYNMDGRDFIKKLVDDKIQFTDVIMNLPADSIEFLDVFSGLFPSSYTNLPIIHCYSFSSAKDTHADVLKVFFY